MTPKSRGGRSTEGICQDCHDMIHVLYPNKQLAAELNSVDLLKADPAFAKYLKWISRRGTHRRYKARRARRR